MKKLEFNSCFTDEQKKLLLEAIHDRIQFLQMKNARADQTELKQEIQDLTDLKKQLEAK